LHSKRAAIICNNTDLYFIQSGNAIAHKESEEATQELLEIPGFVESFERGKKDIAEGQVTPVEQLKRKY